MTMNASHTLNIKQKLNKTKRTILLKYLFDLKLFKI